MNLTVDASGLCGYLVRRPRESAGFQGTSQNVTWDVNGTDSGPVELRFGKSAHLPTTVVTHTAYCWAQRNDGVESITVPTVTASIFTCRIRVETKCVFMILSNVFTINTATDVGVPGSSSNTVGLSAGPIPQQLLLMFRQQTSMRASGNPVKLTNRCGWQRVDAWLTMAGGVIW